MSTENLIKTKAELLQALENCTCIADIFELVRAHNIDLRMQTLQGASCIPPKMLTFDENSKESPIDRLKAVIKLTIENTR
ncbi:MAG: hypothetical protein IJA62_07530 [Ruminococcus sp.]|nr:hypothetical protein [Ruminococcus sp.]